MELFAQYLRVLVVSTLFFMVGVLLIEFAVTRFIRACGKAAILGSYFILAMYGYWVTEQRDEFSEELARYRRSPQGQQQTPAYDATKMALTSLSSVESREIVAENPATGLRVSWKPPQTQSIEWSKF